MMCSPVQRGVADSEPLIASSPLQGGLFLVHDHQTMWSRKGVVNMKVYTTPRLLYLVF